jgi:HEPN domain-containing protein
MKTKRFTEKEGFTSRSLLQFGIDHFNSAVFLYGNGPSSLDSVGYLFHMAIENIFKAICLFKIGYFENIHSLKEILKSIEDILIFNNDNLEILEIIDSYSELRYPRDNNPIEIGTDDFEKIKELYKQILLNIPKELKEEIGSIDLIKKGGRILMVKEEI